MLGHAGRGSSAIEMRANVDDRSRRTNRKYSQPNLNTMIKNWLRIRPMGSHRDNRHIVESHKVEDE